MASVKPIIYSYDDSNVSSCDADVFINQNASEYSLGNSNQNFLNNEDHVLYESLLYKDPSLLKIDSKSFYNILVYLKSFHDTTNHSCALLVIQATLNGFKSNDVSSIINHLNFYVQIILGFINSTNNELIIHAANALSFILDTYINIYSNALKPFLVYKWIDVIGSKQNVLVIIKICKILDSVKDSLLRKNIVKNFLKILILSIINLLKTNDMFCYGLFLIKWLHKIMTKGFIGTYHVQSCVTTEEIQIKENRRHFIYLFRFSILYLKYFNDLCYLSSVKEDLILIGKNTLIIMNILEQTPESGNNFKKEFFDILGPVCLNHKYSKDCLDKCCFFVSMLQYLLEFYMQTDQDILFLEIIYLYGDHFPLELMDQSRLAALGTYILSIMENKTVEIFYKNLLMVCTKINKYIFQCPPNDRQYEYVLVKFFIIQNKILEYLRLKGPLDKEMLILIDQLSKSDVEIINKLGENEVIKAQYLVCADFLIHLTFINNPDATLITSLIIRWISMYIEIYRSPFILQFIEGFKLFMIFNNYLNILEKFMVNDTLNSLYASFEQIYETALSYLI